jgi:hypothetical protein
VYVLCRSIAVAVYLIGVYPIEVYHIRKGAEEVSGGPLTLQPCKESTNLNSRLKMNKNLFTLLTLNAVPLEELLTVFLQRKNRKNCKRSTYNCNKI